MKYAHSYWTFYILCAFFWRIRSCAVPKLRNYFCENPRKKNVLFSAWRNPGEERDVLPGPDEGHHEDLQGVVSNVNVDLRLSSVSWGIMFLSKIWKQNVWIQEGNPDNMFYFFTQNFVAKARNFEAKSQNFAQQTKKTHKTHSKFRDIEMNKWTSGNYVRTLKY